ncbi:helix-turn-helix domain-containing protein [Vagococcus intermedius]|uniref:Helix-turn-helix domain-containing protein n=1 Tax=Vagococcus intermedius TaxID=2991418 RepID=A0AAF0CT40_9ENTE|nr:helix-turn-helix domain-containing protein [Vagococcus intermedius]WEG72445.1 helix-turn-helix domain-containing protein [Vagococcus intermedius]WEG74532.1 helix-turn-helix domain-containing protein [Vagococcus intermedius]
MFSIFLKQNERYSLKILIFIANKSHFTASDIQSLLKVSASSVHRLIKNLNSELIVLSNHSIRITKKDKIFYLFYNHSSFSLTQLIELLMKQFLEKSITFTILTSVISNNHIPVVKLAQKINISTSYLYNCLTDINKKLAPYHVQLILKHQKIKLVGDEATLVIFLFLVSESLTRFTILDNKNALYHQQTFQTTSHNLNETQHDTLSQLLSIARTRHAFQKNLIIKNHDIFEILNNIVTENNLLVRYSHLFEEQSDSLLFYNLFERLIILTSESYDQRLTRGYQLYQIKNNELIRLAKKIIRYFQTNALAYPKSISADNFFETFYYICLFSSCIDLLSMDYIYQFRYRDRQQLFEEESRYYSQTEQHIQQVVRSIISSYSKWDIKQKDAYTVCISRILHTNFSPPVVAKVSIFLHFPESIYTEQAVKKQLNFYFSNTFINYETDISKADIVISDRFMTLPVDISFFLFYDIKSPFLWEKLFIRLTTYLNQAITRFPDHA